MKKFLHLSIVVFACYSLQNNAIAQTTVANGNWSDYNTWGGTPPITTGTVIINHTVTMDVDYAHNSGSITITSNGKLIGNSTMRGFALNYPNGSATISNDGMMKIARTYFGSGTITNAGKLIADSLLNYASINNTATATINATQFFNNTGGDISNLGNIFTYNYLNLATISNYGTIWATDMCNAKTLTNSSTGLIAVTHNFLNTDTLSVSPANYTHNGTMTVGHDFQNGDSPSAITGSGKICVQNNSWNRGIITGTIDYCDATSSNGGKFDLNTGNIGLTVTYCQQPCALGTDNLTTSTDYSIFPNPFSSNTTIEMSQPLENASLVIVNTFGQIVKRMNNISGNTVVISREGLSNGLYFVRLTSDNNLLLAEKIEIND